MTADLRTLAEAATPGPWTADPGSWRPPEWSQDWGYRKIDAGVRRIASTDGAVEGSESDLAHVADAAFIAAANPAVVLALLDERDALRTEVEHHNREFIKIAEELGAEHERLAAEHARALRAEEAEKVAVLIADGRKKVMARDDEFIQELILAIDRLTLQRDNARRDAVEHVNLFNERDEAIDRVRALAERYRASLGPNDAGEDLAYVCADLDRALDPEATP